MASVRTGFLVKATIVEQILIGTAPVIIIGAIASLWRFAIRLDRNTRAIEDMRKDLGELDTITSRVQALENWRDLISAQAVGRELRKE